MNRLIENTVFSGFVMAWRLATWPTRISPSLVKATTDGVRRLPSWLGMTVGVPPSITATTELVVPRSMPMTLLMVSSRHDRDTTRPVARAHLRESHGQHAVPDAGVAGVEVEPRRQRHRPDERAVAALAFPLLQVLAADDQRLRRDGEVEIVGLEAGDLD